MLTAQTLVLDSTPAAFLIPGPMGCTESPGGAQPPVDGPARIYVRRSSALDTLIRRSTAAQKTSRCEALILLSHGSSAGFSLETPAFNGNVHAAFISPTVAHEIKANGGQVIRLAVNLLHPRFGALSKFLGRAAKPLPREAFAPLDESMREACFGTLGLAPARQLMDSIIDIAMRGAAPCPPMDPRIFRMLTLLAAVLDCSFETLAADMGMSRSRLSHLVNQNLGISMRSCQAWMRLARARNQVVWWQELSLTEIAHSLKFADSSHLSRAFKRAYGMSPTSFRDPTVVQFIGHRMPRHPNA